MRNHGGVDKAIERYLLDLDRADEELAKTGSTAPISQIVRTSRNLANLYKEAKRYRAIEEWDGCNWQNANLAK